MSVKWFRRITMAVACAALVCCNGALTERDELTRAARAAEEQGLLSVNLGDYAKGDGTDETDAIQQAFDALKTGNREQAGTLYIPAPAKFYGISSTIHVYDKWNSTIRAETPASPYKKYFHWIGPDEGTMFEFRHCMGLQVENLSMHGHGKSVIGLRIGPEAEQQDVFKYSSFNHLDIYKVGVGIKLGDWPSNGPDIAHNTFRDVVIRYFSRYGVMARSGNLANTTFMNLSLEADAGAVDGIRMDGGELVVLNSCLGEGPGRATGAAIGVYSGGIVVIGSWTEWRGPVLYGHSAPPESGRRTNSSVRFPTLLMGVTHYTAFVGEDAPEDTNPVPLSVVWDRPTPLQLLNCAFWGGVKLEETSRAVIINQGTTFLNRDGLRFLGEGIERHGRILHVGTIHPDNPRVLEPYIVDRRNTPGDAPPSTGIWQKGDRILNTDPNPAVPTKAWAGWICTEPGEPGKWVSYGALAK